MRVVDPKTKRGEIISVALDLFAWLWGRCRLQKAMKYISAKFIPGTISGKLFAKTITPPEPLDDRNDVTVSHRI